MELFRPKINVQPTIYFKNHSDICLECFCIVIHGIKVADVTHQPKFSMYNRAHVIHIHMRCNCPLEGLTQDFLLGNSYTGCS